MKKAVILLVTLLAMNVHANEISEILLRAVLDVPQDQFVLEERYNKISYIVVLTLEERDLEYLAEQLESSSDRGDFSRFLLELVGRNADYFISASATYPYDNTVEVQNVDVDSLVLAIKGYFDEKYRVKPLEVYIKTSYHDL